MEMYKKFKELPLIAQILLLLIPGVNFIVEVVIRACIMLEKKDTKSIVIFLVYLFVGWAWFLPILDLVMLLLKGDFFLVE